MKTVKIYTDGGYNPSTNIGAWAFIIVIEGEIIHESVKSFNKKEKPEMTINRIELESVIKSINWIRSNGYKPDKGMFYVYTDSQYVQLGFNKWMDRRKTLSKNKGMWESLDKLIQSFAEFDSLFINWIPSDSKDIFHMRAHELCQLSMINYLKN